MNEYITEAEALQAIQALMPIFLFCFFMSCMMFLSLCYKVINFIYWFNERKAKP